MKISTVIAFSAACLLAAPAFSDTMAANMDLPKNEKTNASAAKPALTEAEVRKVYKDSGKITLKHGEIKNLDMPGMTMQFKVKDPAMLDGINAGDKVLFTAEQVKGELVVTSIHKKTP